MHGDTHALGGFPRKPVAGVERDSGVGFHKKLAVIHQGALGDFLLSAPVLEGLYGADPSLCIDLWTRPHHGALLEGKPYLGRVHSCEGSELAPFHHDTLWEEAPLPPFFEGRDALLVLGQASSRMLARRLGSRMGCRVCWARSFPAEDHRKQPVTVFARDQVRRCGWPVAQVHLSIEPRPEEMSSVQAWLAERGWRIREAVHVHPGSGGLSKVWPLGRWWALLRWLRFQAGLPVLMSLGPADQQLRDFAVRAQQALEIPVIEGVALTRLAAFLSSARFYIGNDSGVTHLAAAMGIPVVAVFGPTPPEVWAPQGPHVHVIRSRWRKQDILEWRPSKREDPEKPMRESLERLMSR